MNRRRFLTAASMAAIAGPHVSYAAGGQVVVGTWGGIPGDTLRTAIDIPLMKPQGIEVIQSISEPSVRRAKVLAEMNSRRGSMDICFVADYDLFALNQAGALETITPALVPNSANILPFLKESYGAAIWYSPYVILYNKDKVKNPPRSYADLWDPQWAGKVGISDNFFMTATMVASVVAGGSPTNFEPGKPKLLELKKMGLQLYPSTDGVGAALKSEEIWLTINSLARSYSWSQDGLPLESVVPSEGTYVTSYDAGIPRNSRNKDEAFKYLNAMLDPRVQIQYADRMAYLPSVDNAELPAELNAKLNLTPEQKAKLWKVDLAYISAQHAAIFDFWTREVRG